MSFVKDVTATITLQSAILTKMFMINQEKLVEEFATGVNTTHKVNIASNVFHSSIVTHMRIFVVLLYVNVSPPYLNYLTL